MADIFLSYKREDHAAAATLVAALRKSGRTVWWDEGLTPRQAWDATIEREIGAARNVVVLWSPRSVASDWVRTEAHYAQEHAKLVPVVIEACTIPLAFMLKQAVDLSGWRGSPRHAGWRRLLDWLDEPTIAASPPLLARQRPMPAWLSRRHALVALAVAAVLVAAWFALRSHAAHAGGSSLRVAGFAAPPGDTAAANFAQGFAADLAQIVAAGGSKLQVLDGTAPGASAVAADYVLNGNVRSEAGMLRATLTLNSAGDGAIIWSTSLSRPMAQVDAMHLEAEVRAGSVFVCALDDAVRDRSIVSLDALKVYLQACESLPVGDDLETRKILRDVTVLAPDFAQGWATLAEWNGFIASDEQADAADVAPARKEALDAAARALALDPRNSAAWVARALLQWKFSEWTGAQRDLATALALNRDDPIGNFLYASNLRNVGRSGEALDYAIRGANSGPRFWPKTLQVINILADLDRWVEAQDIVATARRTWPDNASIQNAALTIAARYADAKAAAATLADPALIGTTPPERLRLLRTEAAARTNPSPAAAATATAAIVAFFHDPGNELGLALNYAVIGRNDDAYAALSHLPAPLANRPFSGNPSLAFAPYAAGLRADPRFMPWARSQGLVSIWQTTGRWPDFCTAHDAPYDCRAEAARAR